MSSADWDSLAELIERAKELPPGERLPYLERACADNPQLLEEARSLLESKPTPAFLDPPTGGVTLANLGLEGESLGEFILEEEIGRGGMGVVYRAKQPSLNRDVAVKVLFSSFLGRHPSAAERFRREAEAIGRLHHPGIVPVFAQGEDRGLAYYAMEFVDGQCLAERSRSDGVPKTEADFQRIANWIRQAAEALHEAHTHGIVHRDVKPQNILIDSMGNARLVDFGLALDEHYGQISKTGELLGTPSYMSPEQLRAHRQEIDARTDVYSLGVVLYELLTGQRPYQGTTLVEVIEHIDSRPPRRIRAINSSVPRPLESVCRRSIERLPGERYGSAEALSEDLARANRGDHVEADVGRRGRVARRTLRRVQPTRRTLVAAAGASAAAILSVRWFDRRSGLASLEVQVDDSTFSGTCSLLEVDPALGYPTKVLEQLRGHRLSRDLRPGMYRVVLESDEAATGECTLDLREAGSTVKAVLRTVLKSEIDEGMKRIPPGVARIQASSYEDGRREPDRLTLSFEVSSFSLDVLPVTNREYQEFTNDHPDAVSAYADPGTSELWADLPVTGITLDHARRYAEWAGKRLPTLPELLLASQGEDGRTFPWGNDPDPYFAQLNLGRPELGSNAYPADEPDRERRWYLENIVPVGQSPQGSEGPFGHQDLFGNTVAWTASPEILRLDGALRRDETYQLVAGVPAWRSLESARSDGLNADGIAVKPLDHVPYIGIRCARSVDPLTTSPQPRVTDSNQ